MRDFSVSLCSMKTTLNRRQFIRRSLTAALAAATLPSIIPALRPG